MEVKHFLRQARYLDQEINANIREKDQLYSTLQKIPKLRLDAVQESRKNSLDDTYVKIIEMGDEIDQKIDRLIELKKEIKRIINSIEDTRYRIVLSDYYLAMHTWEEVAEINHWSYPHTMRLHGQALLEVNRILKDDTK